MFFLQENIRTYCNELVYYVCDSIQIVGLDENYRTSKEIRWLNDGKKECSDFSEFLYEILPVNGQTLKKKQLLSALQQYLKKTEHGELNTGKKGTNVWYGVITVCLQ